MKEILLSNQGANKNKYVALVDDIDFEWLNQYRWCAIKQGHTYYAVRTIVDNGDKVIQRMHWLIMGTKIIDHINHNGLHNYRANLRACTNQQNTMNKRIMAGHSSKFKGVSWHKKHKKYIAVIGFNYKLIFLGYFNNDADAAIAYNKKAVELFGEFANLNIIS